VNLEVKNKENKDPAVSIVLCGGAYTYKGIQTVKQLLTRMLK